jgi:hypothetical protein
MSFSILNTTIDESTNNTLYKLKSGNFFQSQGDWTGPPLNPTMFLAYNHIGNAVENSNSSFTFDQTSGDTIFSYETYDIINESLYLSATLPDFTNEGPTTNNIFYIGGYNIYAKLSIDNNIQFVVNNASSDIISYIPGNLFYIYMDGVYANFVIVDNETNIATNYKSSYLSNQSIEFLRYGFQNIDSNEFVITINNIHIRSSNTIKLSYYNKSDQNSSLTTVYPIITSLTGINLPFCEIIPFSIPSNTTISILNTGILGRRITLINSSNYTATFNNSGNLYLKGNIATNIALNGMITFIYANLSSGTGIFTPKWFMI